MVERQENLLFLHSSEFFIYWQTLFLSELNPQDIN